MSLEELSMPVKWNSQAVSDLAVQLCEDVQCQCNEKVSPAILQPDRTPSYSSSGASDDPCTWPGAGQPAACPLRSSWHSLACSALQKQQAPVGLNCTRHFRTIETMGHNY
ncbi:unnamed protein product [Polarella glacialis]|uniref:Uncharacterized protein n=1 Tax=Polarella glacialis TaxID=89957 RepID=A0A813GZ77_POLGL|nr:unnamed protein product [Polarella glacialis]